MLKISILDMCLKITKLRLQLYLLGGNELTVYSFSYEWNSFSLCHMQMCDFTCRDLDSTCIYAGLVFMTQLTWVYGWNKIDSFTVPLHIPKRHHHPNQGQCFLFHWQSYRQQSRTVKQSSTTSRACVWKHPWAHIKFVRHIFMWDQHNMRGRNLTLDTCSTAEDLFHLFYFERLSICVYTFLKSMVNKLIGINENIYIFF